MSAPLVALPFRTAVICRDLPSRSPFLLILGPLLLFIYIYPLFAYKLLCQFDVQVFGQT